MSKSTPGDMPGARQSNVILGARRATQGSEATTATSKRQKLACRIHKPGGRQSQAMSTRERGFSGRILEACARATGRRAFPRAAGPPFQARVRRLEREKAHAAASSSSRTMDSPMVEVDTLAMPSCMMSAVRRPVASTLPIASSSRSAAAA